MPTNAHKRTTHVGAQRISRTSGVESLLKTYVDCEDMMTAPTGPAFGIQTSGDVLVNRTADGVDLAVLWTELIDIFQIENSDRTALVNLLSYWHTEVASAVPQTIEGTDFEESTDLGVPKSAGPPSGAALLGFRPRDYDRASRFGWRFLRDANAEQIRAVMESIIHADRKLVTGLILHRIFTPTPSKNEFNYPCYSLWTGDDGFIPPPHLGKIFDDTHSHFVLSRHHQPGRIHQSHASWSTSGVTRSKNRPGITLADRMTIEVRERSSGWQNAGT